MRYHVTLGGRTLEVEVDDGLVRVDGEPLAARLEALAGTDVHALILDGRAHRVVADREADGLWRMFVDGVPVRVEAVDERTRTIRALAGATAGKSGPHPLRAPMPGMVVKVEVREGDVVTPGQGLVIVEAMKMENELRAAAPARVRRVLAAPGQAVEKGQVLIEMEPVEGPEEDRT